MISQAVRVSGLAFEADAAGNVVRDFGFDRMLHVLANTVRQKDWDERFSGDNRRWALTVPVCEDQDGMGGDKNSDFVLRSHSVKADAFIQTARHEYLLSQPLKAAEVIDEARRILAGLTEAKEPNSPNGAHFMVEVSPDFLRRASDKDRDTLMNLLPFKSLSLSPLNGRRGTFALIPKDEDRAGKTELKKPSVRRKLKEQPDAPAASKPPARRRARKPER